MAVYLTYAVPPNRNAVFVAINSIYERESVTDASCINLSLFLVYSFFFFKVSRIDCRFDHLQCRLVDALDRDAANALADPHNYLGNAVNSFRLTRRLAVDWQRAVNEDVRNDDRKGRCCVASKCVFFSCKEVISLQTKRSKSVRRIFFFLQLMKLLFFRSSLIEKMIINFERIGQRYTPDR